MPCEVLIAIRCTETSPALHPPTPPERAARLEPLGNPQAIGRAGDYEQLISFLPTIFPNDFPDPEPTPADRTAVTEQFLWNRYFYVVGGIRTGGGQPAVQESAGYADGRGDLNVPPAWPINMDDPNAPAVSRQRGGALFSVNWEEIARCAMASPHRTSFGLMQTLITTANTTLAWLAGIPGFPGWAGLTFRDPDNPAASEVAVPPLVQLTAQEHPGFRLYMAPGSGAANGGQWLLNGFQSLLVGAAFIRHGYLDARHGGDLPLVASAYNAGFSSNSHSVHEDNENPWGARFFDSPGLVDTDRTRYMTKALTYYNAAVPVVPPPLVRIGIT